MARSAVESFSFAGVTDNTTAETLGFGRIYDNGFGAGYVGVVGEQMRMLFTGTPRFTYRVAGTYNTNQFAKLQIGSLSTISSRQFGVGVRSSADTGATRDYYEWWFSRTGTGDHDALLVKYVNGTPTTLDSRAVTLANADSISIEAVDSGANVDLKCYVNDVILFTVTDSTSPLSGGKPIWSISGADTPEPTLDNFEFGDVTGGTSHATSGALSGSGAAISGAATLTTTSHPTTGALAGTGAAIAGTAARRSPRIVTGALKNDSGSVIASTTIDKLVAIKLSDLSTVTWTSQSTDGSGVLTLESASLANATDYLLVTSNATGTARGVGKYTTD